MSKELVGTIHSIKGETHDATLILETKLHQNDLQQMLPHIKNSNLERPTTNRKITFMRKLYVAGSRSHQFVCIAMHKDNLSNEQIAQLVDQGWNVANLSGTEGDG